MWRVIFVLVMLVVLISGLGFIFWEWHQEKRDRRNPHYEKIDAYAKHWRQFYRRSIYLLFTALVLILPSQMTVTMENLSFFNILIILLDYGVYRIGYYYYAGYYR